MNHKPLAPATHNPFAGPTLSARLPLTEAQREVWLAAQIDPGANLAYNEAGTLTFIGALDVPALLASLQTLVDRHEVLRAGFSPNGQWLTVRESMQLEVPVIDISADPVGLLAQYEHAAANQPFELVDSPLLRYQLLRAGPELHHLLRVAHHAIVDGWSCWVLSNELGQLYSAAVEGRDAALPPATRYGDYAQIEQDFVASAEGRSHLDYWLKTLDTPPNQLSLPHDLPRPSERTYEAGRVDVPIDPALVGRLRKLGAAHGASLVATTLAAFSTLLHRLSGAEDLIVGLAAAGQSFHNQSHLVGHAVNLLPLRLKPRGDMPFTALMAATRATVLDAFDHQGASFGTIVPELKFERDPARPPLVPIMFNIDVRSGDVVFSGLQTSYRTLERPAEIFELFVNMVDDGKSLLLECAYNRNLFTADAIRARMAEYGQLLAAVCDAPETRLADLPLLTPDEQQQIDALNATAQPLPTAMLSALIAVQVARTPAAIAVRFGEATQSYAELEAHSNGIAAALAAAGAGAGCFVGVCLERSIDLPAALLAVLKTGAAYLPLDPEFPPERLAYYLEDAAAALVLCDAGSATKLVGNKATLLQLEELTGDTGFASVTPEPDAPAYIIYTSGSTGQPKGVVVPHKALANFLLGMQQQPGMNATDVLAAVTTLSFDIAGLELWLPLVSGASVAILDRDTAMDGEQLKSALVRHGITIMQATPATWRLLLTAGWAGDPASFTACSGGEPLPRELAEQLLPRVKALWNLYGPTETTVWSTAHRITDASQPILIGQPIANTQCHVLDAALTAVPPGVTGTLWIGGAGLATGYHARPELTAERFVEHSAFGRLYNTGDLARLTPQGLECLGRIDFQVKLRGYRIELGEIEYALSRHAAVAESAVLVRERGPGDARLVAYVALKPGTESNASELRNAVRGFLPAYMLPQEFMMLPALPRLPNGKLDRKALPDPFSAIAKRPAREPPLGAIEEMLAGLWAEVLGLRDLASISREDRFFDLGGHSLLAVRLAGRLAEKTGQRPGLRKLMMDPLLVIAAALAPAGAVPPPAITKPIEAATAPVEQGARHLPRPSSVLLSDIAIPARQSMPRKTSWLGKLFGD